MQRHLFWQLGALSDSALIDGLHRVVGAGRQLLAELLAHLCEVEDRRLHLDAGYPSMFAYCVGRLRLSEDEAYRRIVVARLARRAPRVYSLIAEGRLSLSAAALLKPYVLSPNIAELVDAMADKSVQAAREALAAFFPRPDVKASVRKLPASKPLPNVTGHTSLFQSAGPPTDEDGAPRPATVQPELAPAPHPSSPVRHRPPPPAHRLEPLSPGRYKIQFTASTALNEKLALARDLLRHTVPSGDLASIMERALDLLVTDLMKRRFGAGARSKKSPCPQAAAPQPPLANEQRVDDNASPAPHAPVLPPSRGISRDTCRRVLERDGLRCTWRGPDGTRCDARAWLERDHRTPRGLGGTSAANNVRHLCKAHNRRAAEHVYGVHHIERAIHHERNERQSRSREHTRHRSPPPLPSTATPANMTGKPASA